jgi:hypothetical protein
MRSAARPRRSARVITSSPGGRPIGAANPRSGISATCRILTISVGQMTNQTVTYNGGGDAEVQILSPKGAELASWYGWVPESAEVTAY